jgi:hypothetical protein
MAAKRSLSTPVILSAARGSVATKGKSKDPDNVPIAMQRQGILPMLVCQGMDGLCGNAVDVIDQCVEQASQACG